MVQEWCREKKSGKKLMAFFLVDSLIFLIFVLFSIPLTSQDAKCKLGLGTALCLAARYPAVVPGSAQGGSHTGTRVKRAVEHPSAARLQQLHREWGLTLCLH